LRKRQPGFLFLQWKNAALAAIRISGRKEQAMKRIYDMVNGKTVKFSHCRDGALWYRTECGFEFPVPFAEIGTATFYAEDRAPLFIRYIRRQQKFLAMAYAEQRMHQGEAVCTPG
jgi:hypothetical protein